MARRPPSVVASEEGECESSSPADDAEEEEDEGDNAMDTRENAYPARYEVPLFAGCHKARYPLIQGAGPRAPEAQLGHYGMSQDVERINLFLEPMYISRHASCVHIVTSVRSACGRET